MADDEDLRDPMVDDTPAEEVTCSGTIGIRLPGVRHGE